MKERPILFSGAMVRAILDGKKTQTRRVIKTYRDEKVSGWEFAKVLGGQVAGIEDGKPIKPYHGIVTCCPYGQPGDRLWVRETWFKNMDGEILYRADYGSENYEGGAKGWKPSIHMRRDYSRITLEVISVRVERLHRIGEVSAKAEGVDPKPVVSVARGESYLSYCEAFSDLWDSINAKRSYGWESNPWVWVVEFSKVI